MSAQNRLNDYEFSPVEPGMEEKIVKLLDSGFNGWPKVKLSCTPEDFWRWKYLDNPTGKTVSHVVLHEGEIICCDHSVPHLIKIGAESQLCAIRTDMTVHPDHRGKGVWKQSQSYANEQEIENGLSLIHYMTGNQKLIKRLSAMRPSFPHEVVNMVRIKDIDTHLEAMPVKQEWLIKTGFKTLSMLNRVTHKKSQNGDANFFKVQEVERFDETADRFWGIIKDHYSFIVERNKEYLNWRYCDPRSGGFNIHAVTLNGSLAGFIVTAVNRLIHGYPVGYIVDLLAVPGMDDVVRVMVEYALNILDDQGVNIVNFLSVRNHPYTKILGEYGFLDSRVNINMFYQTHREVGMNQLHEEPPEKIHYCWGDHDSLPLTATRS